MAKSKNKGAFLILILGGIVVAYMMLQKRSTPASTNYSSVPPPPPRNNAQALATWANTILAIYGNVAELWQPGGPFYNYKNDLLEIVTPPNNYDNGLPFDDTNTGQWV